MDSDFEAGKPSAWTPQAVYRSRQQLPLTLYGFCMSNFLLAKLGICTHGKTVADVGGGTGHIGKNIASGTVGLGCDHAVDVPARVLVVDASSDMLAVGKQAFAHIGNLEFREGDLTQPLADDLRAGFDLVISVAVIHNFTYAQQPAALANLLGFARPQGEVLYVDVVLSEAEFRLLQEMKGDPATLESYVLNRYLEDGLLTSVALGGRLYPLGDLLHRHDPALSIVHTLRDECPLRARDVRTAFREAGCEVLDEGDVPGTFVFFKYFHARKLGQ